MFCISKQNLKNKNIKCKKKIIFKKKKKKNNVFIFSFLFCCYSFKIFVFLSIDKKIFVNDLEFNMHNNNDNNDNIQQF
jgi:hypothetical protein